MLLNILKHIKDSRRKQGQRYDFANLLYIIILGILSGSTSYRKLAIFIELRYDFFKEALGLGWKGCPDHSTIRKFIQNIDKESLESSFREYSFSLDKESKYLAIDGKTLRGSFDNFHDKKALQILSVFDTENHIILAHKDISNSDKTNEIPKLQDLIEEIGLTDKIFTIDAMHCQKKL